MNKLLVMCAMLAVSLAIATCKKKQPAMKSGLEGCDCAKKVSAEFTIEEVGGTTSGNLSGRNNETDTTWVTKNLRFHALEDNAEYTWYLGNEIITERTFFRNVGSAYANQDVTPKLIVNKQSNKICFPNDDGIDSMIKSVHMLPSLCLDELTYHLCPQLITRGLFKVSENGGDSIITSFKYKPYWQPPVSGNIYLISNLINSDTSEYQTDFGGYRKVWLYGLEGQYITLYVKQYNNVEIVYTQNLPNLNISIKRVFRGRKIQ